MVSLLSLCFLFFLSFSSVLVVSYYALLLSFCPFPLICGGSSEVLCFGCLFVCFPDLSWFLLFISCVSCLFHSFFFFFWVGGPNSAEIWRELSRDLERTAENWRFQIFNHFFRIFINKLEKKWLKCSNPLIMVKTYPYSAENWRKQPTCREYIFSMSYIYVSWYELVKTYLFWSCFG